MKRIYPAVLLIFFFLFSFHAKSQMPKVQNAADIKLALNKLNVLGNVMYLAAHPDDENTRLIGYLSKGRLLTTSYLAVTRGDGGQNLIGEEIKEELGIIRTQELLQARRVDGSEQFFTRGIDFGYSKSAEETLKIWGEDEVLSDVVWVIRNFRPDVIITRFPADERAGHGHHTSSAILAAKAFDLAADPKAYPEQLKDTQTWQPKRLLMNTGRWWNKDIDANSDGVVTVDVGAYNALLGQSYNEISALSRSMHKTQGFGNTGSRGEQLEFLEYVKGDKAQDDLLDGIDVTWKRVKGGESIQKSINRINENFKISNPSASVPQLLDLYTLIGKLDDKFWREKKQKEVKNIIKSCLGLYLEVKVDDFYAVAGSSIALDFEMINRSDIPVKVKNINVLGIENKLSFSDAVLASNEKITHKDTILLSTKMPVSQPYWLTESGSLGMFKVDNQALIGMPENTPVLEASFSLDIGGETFNYTVPIIYKWNDPVKGELYRPFAIIPEVAVNIEQGIVIFPNTDSKEITIIVKAGKDNIQGLLKVDLPTGWKSVPENMAVNLDKKYAEQKVTFKIFPPDGKSTATIKAHVEMDGKQFSKGIKTIQYDHIPTQTIFGEATSKLVKLDIQKRGELIGYVKGAGDAVPENLELIGYDVTMLTDDEITLDNLKKYDAVIMGIRAYNTNERIGFYQKELLAYVHQGGNLIVQYNTRHRLKIENLAPYMLKLSRDRVTQEDAEAIFLAPKHPVLNTPNKITKADFDGWVQERGLYFPEEWSSEFTPILSWYDEGEEENPKKGSLLIAKYGKGNYVYTGISFFRELPAGVPGAFRLFTNIISLEKNHTSTNPTN